LSTVPTRIRSSDPRPVTTHVGVVGRDDDDVAVLEHAFYTRVDVADTEQLLNLRRDRIGLLRRRLAMPRVLDRNEPDPVSCFERAFKRARRRP
jgi:hypothetical protein